MQTNTTTLNPLTIRAYDADLNLIGLIEEFTSSSFTRSFAGIGEFELIVDAANTLEIETLKQASFLKYEDDVCGLIRSIQDSLNESSHEFTIRGVELKGLAEKRIVLPKHDEESVIYSQRSPEFIMADLIKTQLTNPETPARQIPGIIRYEDSSDLIDYEDKFEKLSDSLESIAETNAIGWTANIEVDSANKAHIVWKIFRGKNRTMKQHDNEPLIFDTGYDTIRSEKFEQNLHTINTAIVAGPGEGISRANYTVNAANAGLERSEIYVDARNIEAEDLNAALKEQGEAALAKYGTDQTVELKPSVYEIQRYRKEFDLGDIGTLPHRGIDLQLTEIQHIYDRSQLQLVFTLGYDTRTIRSALQRITANFNAVVKTEFIVNSKYTEGASAVGTLDGQLIYRRVLKNIPMRTDTTTTDLGFTLSNIIGISGSYTDGNQTMAVNSYLSSSYYCFARVEGGNKVATKASFNATSGTLIIDYIE